MDLQQYLQLSGSVILPALLLDILLGDPIYPLHPVRLCGKLLALLEVGLRKLKFDGYGGGILLFVLLSGLCLGTVLGIQFLAAALHPLAEYAWKLYITWSLLALGDLCRHGNQVARAAEQNNLEQARHYTGRLVGRDLDKMQITDCCRATIESLSENLTDGVLSPLFFYFLFGIPGLVLFKVVSTMDSMVGYKNERYLQFGWCGARLDDLMNFIPARLTWLILSFLALVLPGYRGIACLKTGFTQHAAIPGPNSGWSEAAAAGALNLQLIGPIWRENILVANVWIGPPDGHRESRPEDLRKMILLARAATLLPVIILPLLVNIPIFLF